MTAPKKTGMTLVEIANDGKALGRFVATTLTAYGKLHKMLHETACATLFHTAQYGECHALNTFHNGMTRKDDRTAFRVWLGTHATYVDLNTQQVKPWLTWSEKDGFRVVKGTESHRKDMFMLGGDDKSKTDLLALKPFYEKSVADRDAITLEKLLGMLKHVAERVERESEKNDIKLPENVVSLIHDVEKVSEKELEAIEAARKAKEKREAA